MTYRRFYPNQIIFRPFDQKCFVKNFDIKKKILNYYRLR